jgi:hypothetical protein
MTARQPFCHPFRHKDDERLNVSIHYLCSYDFIVPQWLEHTFLVYLDGWEKNVYNREGFTLSEKKRMLLSTETLQGIRRTGTQSIVILSIYTLLLFSKSIH